MKLPSCIKKYFWETDAEKIDPDKYPYFVIERILEYGDKKALRWLLKNFKLCKIKNVLLQRRNISLLSANYWALILKISKNQILCLKKQSQNKLQRTWTY